ncbi:cytochrome C [Runella rosea]|uniref:Cytochrome C n=1 Tax=Runella rosea TaxID=2259595 RepID=A0A344TMH6_9BACT|nr:heme-binding domain-containing protein [Runella rosea]AXE19847.1 cytochrome C [Runella rosea]
MIKKILIGLGVVLVAIQFFHPEKNLSDDRTYDVSTKYAMPEEVKSTLKVACDDCHSNKTEYPWYSNIQPVAWFLDHHVVDGKRHLNFSNFTSRPIAYQNHKFEETIEMIKEGEMPLPSYTYFGLHSGAKLTEAQKQTLISWAEANMDSLKANYPADSLVMRRPQGATPAK